MRGLYLGRFQPFHNGHRSVIEQLYDDVDELIIGIGSAERSHTNDNPFTCGERIEMIHLANPQPEDTFIIPIPDIASNAKWVAHIQALVPRFSVVYSNNPLVIQLFTEANYTVNQIPPVNRQDYQGTIVRERLRTDSKWRELVPEAVERFLDEVSASDRLTRIAHDDHSLPE